MPSFLFLLPLVLLSFPLASAQLISSFKQGGRNDIITTTVPMYVQLEYRFASGTNVRSPTELEILDLMCQTDEFFTEQIYNETLTRAIDANPTDASAIATLGLLQVESTGTFIDWELDLEAVYPVKVTFLLDTSFSPPNEEAAEIVNTETVEDALQLDLEEIMVYLEQFVWKTSPNNLFQDATAVNVTIVPQDPPWPLGRWRLQGGDCPRNETIEGGPNVDSQVFFTLQYGFENGKATEPTVQQINDLICSTNQFYTDTLRKYTKDDTVESQAIHIDWSFSEETLLPLQVSFFANATDGDGTLLTKDVVLSAMDVKKQDIVWYVSEYVWQTRPVFEDINSVNFTDYDGNNPYAHTSVPIGELEQATCPEATFTVAPSMSPSSQPSVFETVVSTTSTPTINTSSPAPTSTPSPTNTPQPTTSELFPLTAVSFSNAPTMETTASTWKPTEEFVWKEYYQVESSFIVSNTQGIREPQEIFDNGLDAAWPVLAEEVVRNVTASDSVRKLQQWQTQPTRLAEGSAFVTDVSEIDCSDESPSAICHRANAHYTVFTSVQELDILQAETDQAINNGTFQSILIRETPDSPLLIGDPPPLPTDSPTEEETNKDTTTSEGFPGWAIALIVIASLLCCCCCIPMLLYGMSRGGSKGEPNSAHPPTTQSRNVDREVEEPNAFPAPVVQADAKEEVEWAGGERVDQWDESPNAGIAESIAIRGGSLEEKWDDEFDEELAAKVSEGNKFAKETQRLLLLRESDERISEPVLVMPMDIQQDEPTDEGLPEFQFDHEGDRSSSDRDIAATIGTSEYAVEAHRSLLETGNNEDFGLAFELAYETDDEATVSLDIGEREYETDVSLDEGVAGTVGSSEAVQEWRRLLLETGNDDNVSGPFESGRGTQEDMILSFGADEDGVEEPGLDQGLEDGNAVAASMGVQEGGPLGQNVWEDEEDEMGQDEWEDEQINEFGQQEQAAGVDQNMVCAFQKDAATEAATAPTDLETDTDPEHESDSQSLTGRGIERADSFLSEVSDGGWEDVSDSSSSHYSDRLPRRRV